MMLGIFQFHVHFSVNHVFVMCKFYVERSSSAVERQNQGSAGSNPGPLLPFRSLGIFDVPRYPSSLGYLNKYQTTDWWKYYMGEYFSYSNCSIAECFPKKLGWWRNEQVCHGVKCKAIWAVLWIGWYKDIYRLSFKIHGSHSAIRGFGAIEPSVMIGTS